MNEVQRCCTKCGEAMTLDNDRCTACGVKQKVSRPGQTVSDAAALLIVGLSAVFLIALVIIIY